MYLDAWGCSRRRDPSGHLRRRPAAPRVPLGPPIHRGNLSRHGAVAVLFGAAAAQS